MILNNHFQNAYVTADIDKAVAILTEQFGITRDPPRLTANSIFWTPDGEGEAILKLAFVQVGRLQYELIEPVSGQVALYKNAVSPDRPLTLHHVAMRVDDLEPVRIESEKHGRKVAMRGEAQGIKFMYVDARATLGHYLEYVAAPDSFWDSMKGR